MSEKVKKANMNRAQKAQAEHAKKTEERANDAKRLKAIYLKEKDSEIVQDILAKCKNFIAYHTKLGQDAVGVRTTGHLLVNGQKETETYFFSNDEIAGEMKKASGIQELLDYVERQITMPVPDTKVKKPAQAKS